MGEDEGGVSDRVGAQKQSNGGTVFHAKNISNIIFRNIRNNIFGVCDESLSDRLSDI